MADPPEHPLLIISLWDLHPETWCAHEYIQRRDYRNAVREASERLVERAGEIAYAEGEIRLATISLLHEHLDDVTYLGSAQPPEAAGA